MAQRLARIDAISLFVEDLAAARSFYDAVFGAKVVFADDASVALRFDNLIVNLLRVESAHEIVAPGPVGRHDAGSRFQLTVFVTDVDASCAELARRGITMLAGPLDRPWGMRTANFVDPGGHSWELAMQIAQAAPASSAG